MKEAMFFRKLKDNVVQCSLCPHSCVIKDNERGKCGVRENRQGVLYALTYGKPISSAIDPIEKKPLYHFLPGSSSYSIACVGCNLSCLFCQNSDISQMLKEGRILGTDASVQDVVDEAIASGCKSISYTYTEPTIFFEYAYDIARLAKSKGIKNVFVTNGFISKDAIEFISPFLDAANIDLKGFTDEYYQRVCGARLQPVLDAIQLYYDKGVHIELTTLIVPGQNDDPSILKSIAEFIARIDKRIPWHISRFFPQYKMAGLPPTPVESIRKAEQIGKESGLKYIYPGNLGEESDTACQHCSKTLIKRKGFFVSENNLVGERCRFCNAKADIITK
ncbi:MAG: AmmeMemoRadiSam system radical SAM enzyme [Candidatus Woesearchaeota archaeon]